LEKIKQEQATRMIKKSDLSVDFMREEVIEQLHLPPNKNDIVNTEELYSKISSDLAQYNVLFEALDQIFKDKYSGTEEAIDVDDAHLEKFLELFSTTNHMIKKVIDSFVIISSAKLPIVDGDLEALEFDFSNKRVTVSEVDDEVFGDAGIANIVKTDIPVEDDEFANLLGIHIDESGFTDEEANEGQIIDGFDPKSFLRTKANRDVDDGTKPKEVDDDSKPKDVDDGTKPQDLDNDTKPKDLDNNSKPQDLDNDTKPQDLDNNSKPKKADDDSKPQDLDNDTKPQDLDTDTEAELATLDEVRDLKSLLEKYLGSNSGHENNIELAAIVDIFEMILEA
jgi:hypothetical protein